MSAGVYELAHKASGYVYVGGTLDLDRRALEWREVLDWLGGVVDVRRKRKAPKASLRFQHAVREVGVTGWEFSVLWRLPVDALAVGELLWQQERGFIEAARERVGSRCLNRWYPNSPWPHGPRPRYLGLK